MTPADNISSSHTDSASEAIRDTDTVNRPDYVLPMLSNYLLEAVFNEYRLTISHECKSTVDMTALYVYASHFIALPFRLEAWNIDRTANTLVRLAGLLLPNCLTTVSAMPSNTDDVKPLRVSTNITDQKTDMLLDEQLLPNRARMDTGYVRERLRVSADVWRARIVPEESTPIWVIHRIAFLGGNRWKTAAYRMIGR